MNNITSEFAAWLAAGGYRVGEVAIASLPGGGYRLTHWEEATRADLTRYTVPEDARAIAMYDDAGEFRPLKTAPSLRRGWALELPDLPALVRALDYFYPAALGVWHAWKQGRLQRVPLRDTLERQTGMYAVTKKATDEEINRVVARCCNSEGGCLKTILWEISPGNPVRSLPAGKFSPPEPWFPLLCNEGCNLLVGAIRAEVKKDDE